MKTIKKILEWIGITVITTIIALILFAPIVMAYGCPLDYTATEAIEWYITFQWII